jgi:hypothetical protein
VNCPVAATRCGTKVLDTFQAHAYSRSIVCGDWSPLIHGDVTSRGAASSRRSSGTLLEAPVIRNGGCRSQPARGRPRPLEATRRSTAPLATRRRPRFGLWPAASTRAIEGPEPLRRMPLPGWSSDAGQGSVARVDAPFSGRCVDRAVRPPPDWTSGFRSEAPLIEPAARA